MSTFSVSLPDEICRELGHRLRGNRIAIGFDGNQDLQGFVRDGTIQGIAVQGSYQMGYKGIQTVVSVIEHKSVPKLVDTGVVLVDKQNLDSQQAKNVLY